MIKKSSFLRCVLAVLSPVAVFMIAIFCASILAYAAVSVLGDDVSYRTIFKKFTQFFLVVSLLPLMMLLKLNWGDLGFAARHQFINQLKHGAGLGFVTLFPVLCTLVLLDIHVVDDSKPWTAIWLGKKLLLEFFLALLISLVEEPLFRGILVTGLQRTMPATGAVIIGAFYYAALHFMNSNIELPADRINALSGFVLLQDALMHVFNRNYLTPFIALWTVGMFLGLIRTRINLSLGLCIGCHASWVWQIKLSKLMFNTNPQSDYLYFVSGYDGVIGPLVTVWLMIAMMGYFGFYRKIRRGEV